jgi:hypothetical protein
MMHIALQIGFVWCLVSVVVVLGLGAIIRRAEAQSHRH